LLHAELAEDCVAQALSDFLIAVPGKRCLFAVQVDLRVLSAFNELRTEGCKLLSELGKFHDVVALLFYPPYQLPSNKKLRTRSLVRVSGCPVDSPGHTTARATAMMQ
jgi:hypothetical protein